MKVIHVPRRFVASEWGGTETVLLQISRALIRAGHDTQIFTSMALADRAQETMQGVPVRRFSYTYPYWGLDEKDIHQMDRKGGNLLSFSLLWALLREPDVDLLHAHSGKRLGGVVRTAAKLRGIPYVITLHGGVFDVPKKEMEQMLAPIRNTFEWGKPFGAILGSRRVLQDAAAVICVGENEAVAAQKALPDQRVEFIPNGVDSRAFAEGDAEGFRAQFAIPADRRLILCVSRIDFQKNQIALVEAMKMVLDKYPDAHLVLIGPITVAHYHQRLMNKVAELGLGNRITLIPGMTPDDPMLKGAYHAAEVFCLPSLHEPFGIVILEAWAARLPVVTAKVGGIPFFTKDGSDAIYVDPEDPSSVASGLIRVMDDPALREKLATTGLRRARKEFDWSIVAERLLHIYQDLKQGG